MNLEDLESKEQLIYEFYNWIFQDKRIISKDVVLEKEIDISLAPYYIDANIYYPKQISELFNTTAFKRIGRISQLSRMIDIHENVYHNRLEHSKGVYYRKLEEMLYNFQNSEWKSYIEQNDLRIYLLADLIKMLGHDIGHLPLSHALEEQIYNTHGAHEIIGKRIMLENKEILNILNAISPDLPDILSELYNKKILNFQEHDESNYDVDRLDYMCRDSLYLGNPKHFSHQKYETIFTEDGMTDVYPYSSLQEIEKFLYEREQGYLNFYFSQDTHMRDCSIGIFLKAFMESNCNVGMELKNFINQLKTNSIDDIDIERYLEWDDIKLYSELIDIAQAHENTDIRDLATMVMPNMKAFLNMLYSHFNMNTAKKYSESDKAFLKKVRFLITSNSRLSHNLRDSDFLANNSIIIPDTANYPDCFSHIITDNYLTNSVKSTIKAYKVSEPLYVKDSFGIPYELSKHPERSCDWENRKIQMIYKFTYIPFLRYNGLDEKLICDMQNYFVNNKSQSKQDRNCLTTNMQPLQVGHNIEDSFLEI